MAIDSAEQQNIENGDKILGKAKILKSTIFAPFLEPDVS